MEINTELVDAIADIQEAVGDVIADSAELIGQVRNLLDNNDIDGAKKLLSQAADELGEMQQFTENAPPENALVRWVKGLFGGRKMAEEEVSESVPAEGEWESVKAMAETKTEDGVQYGPEHYLYVPDPNQPSTWKLRIAKMVNGRITVTRDQLGAAAAALGPGGFRGQRVQLPPGEREKVIRKLKAEYRKLGVKDEEMPAYLQQFRDTAALSETGYLTGVSVGLDEIGRPIQIMRTGSFDHPEYGKINITEDDLAEIKANFDAKIRGQEIPIDVDHKHDQGAIGWIEEIQHKKDKLFAVPRWTDKGVELLKAKAFKYFSPHFGSWQDPETGKKYSNVLFSGALTNFPFLKHMEPVALNEFTTWRNNNMIELTELQNQVKQLTEQLIASQTQIKEMSEKLEATKKELEHSQAEKDKFMERAQALERENRVRRFTEMAREWVGERSKHIEFLEKLANQFGEDSDDFKWYVSERNAEAKRLKESGLLEELGSTGGGKPIGIEERIDAEARKLVEAGVAKTMVDARMHVLTSRPDIYTEYNKSHMARVKGTVND